MVVWQRERRRWVAIVAAYALVLQAVLTGFGAAAVAAGPAPQLDAFGGVICSFAGGAGHDAPGQPSQHRGLDCLAHCAFSINVALPPPDVAGVAGRLTWQTEAPPRPLASATLRSPALGSLGPRGPPATT